MDPHSLAPSNTLTTLSPAATTEELICRDIEISRCRWTLTTRPYLSRRGSDASPAAVNVMTADGEGPSWLSSGCTRPPSYSRQRVSAISQSLFLFAAGDVKLMALHSSIPLHYIPSHHTQERLPFFGPPLTLSPLSSLSLPLSRQDKRFLGRGLIPLALYEGRGIPCFFFSEFLRTISPIKDRPLFQWLPSVPQLLLRRHLFYSREEQRNPLTLSRAKSD